MRLVLATLAAGVLCCMPAYASPITYGVTETVGGATATGTITTDGTLGILSSVDITNFLFTLSSGGASQTISGGGPGLFAGSDLTATANGLFFNFSDQNVAGAIFGPQPPYFGFISNGTVYNNGSGGADTASFQISVNGRQFDSGTVTGNQQIGTAVSVTPEPSSFILLGTGALGLLGAARRKYRNA